eukprot:258105_1
MEAKVQKKPLEGKFKSWSNRLWRIQDRRLICYKAECNEWKQCSKDKIKLEVDIAKMTSASFHPKSNPKPNQLLIKHPKIAEAYGQGAGGGLILRFTDKEENMAAWLKVLTSWSVDKEKNRIYVAIPSNFSYAIWSVLNALYEHPLLLKSEGVFRREMADKRVKQVLCNDLLYEKISMEALKETHNNVYLLANSLKYLLTMLPSSIFGDQNFEELQDGLKQMGIGTEEKKGNDVDVSNLSDNKLANLKARIDAMYASSKYKHRYGLISLILHLLKRVTQHSKATRMTCDSLANMFAMCFESKEWQQNSLTRSPMSQLRSIPLVKVLIYHAMFLFPEKEWTMDEVVVAEAVEAKTLELYHELQLTKKQRRARVKSVEKITPPDPTKHFTRQASISTRMLPQAEPKTTQQSTPNDNKQIKSDAPNHVNRDANANTKPNTKDKPKKTKPASPQAGSPQTLHTSVPPPPSAPPPPSKPVPKKPPPPATAPPPDAVAAADTSKAAKRANVVAQARPQPPQPVLAQGTKSRGETLVETNSYSHSNVMGGGRKKKAQVNVSEELKRSEAEKNKLHLANIQLKTQILDLEQQLRSKGEECVELHNQVSLKNKILEKLNQQVIDGKISELERKVAEKDSNIQQLQQKVLTMAMQAQPAPLAPAPMAIAKGTEFYDHDVHGLSLEDKLKQRPSWVELSQRGIVFDEEHHGVGRKKHRRTASQKLRSMLSQRPTKEELTSVNIWREEATRAMIDDAVALALRSKLEQRPDWQEVQERGILLDDAAAAARKDHKRNASLTVENMLQNRPTPEQLEANDIIDPSTAALFFGASPQEIVTEIPRSRQEIEERLALKLADRPVMDQESMVLISTNAQLKEREGEIGELRSELARLKAHSRELEESHKSLATRAQSHQRAESEATEELAQLGQQLHDDSLQLEHLKEENQRMALAYDLAKEDGEKYREEANTLKERIGELEGRTEKTQATEDLLTSARDRLAELDVKVGENERLQSELAFYKKETERMEVQLNLEQQNYLDQKQQNKELEAQIAKEKEKVKHLSQQFEQTDIDKIAQESQWEEEIDELKEKVTTITRHKQDEEQRVHALQRELEEIRQSMESQETLQSDLNELRQTNERYQRETNELQGQQSDMNRRFEEKENEFESEIERLRQSQSQMENQISKLKEEQDSFVNEIGVLRESKMMLVISTAQEIDALRTQIKMFSKGNWNEVIGSNGDVDDITITVPSSE